MAEHSFTGVCSLCKLPINNRKLKFIRSSHYCSCKHCYLCNEKTSIKHCPICHRPTCTKDTIPEPILCTDKVSRNPCRSCHKEIQLLQQAGDTHRLQKLGGSSAHIRSGSGAELPISANSKSQFVHVRVKDHHFPTEITAHPKVRSSHGSSIFFNLVSVLTDDTKRNHLYSSYCVNQNNSISPVSTSKLQVLPGGEIRDEDIEVYQLAIDSPLIATTTNLLDDIHVGAFVRSNQEAIVNQYNKVTLIEMIEMIRDFYKCFRSMLFDVPWISNLNAQQEEIKWSNALKFLEKSRRASTDRTKLGEIMDSLTASIRDHLEKSKQEIYLPITWEQEYSIASTTSSGNPLDGSSKSQEDPLPDDGHPPNESSNGESSTGFEALSKRQQMTEHTVLWVVIKPSLSKPGSVDISFINSSQILSHLFPDCVQVHVPIQSRKLKAKSMYRAPPSFGTSEKSLTESLNPIGLVTGQAGLRPGSAGSVNKVDYLGVSYDLLESVLSGLVLMQSIPLQKDPQIDMFVLTSRLSSIAGFLSKLSGEKTEEEDQDLPPSSDSSSDLSAKRFAKMSNIWAVSSMALRANMDASMQVPFEEELCKEFLDARSLMDGKPLTGHAMHILEAIFTFLQQEESVQFQFDQSSVVPLLPGRSICEAFFLLKKCTLSKLEYIQMETLWNIFILRSSLTKASSMILKDAAQRVYFKAMNHPSIFGPHETTQIRELEMLKILLESLLYPKLQLNPLQNRTASLDTIRGTNSSSNGTAFRVSPLVLCAGGKRVNLPRIKAPDLFYPDCSPLKLQLKWATMTYREFDQLWTQWLETTKHLHSIKDYSLLQTVVLSMVDAVPDNFSLFHNSMREGLLKINPKEETPLQWINRWALVLFRISQFLFVVIFSRLGIHMRSVENLHKWGLVPEELLALLKLVVSLDQLYRLPECEDVDEILPTRPPLEWKYFIQLAQHDHYLGFSTPEQNKLFQDYIEYLSTRMKSSKGFSFMPKEWDYNMDRLDDNKEETIFDSERKNLDTILDGIVTRAETFYGGPIPNVDSFGNHNLNETLATAMSREKAKFNYDNKANLTKAKIHYNNLRTPDNKRKPKISGLAAFLQDSSDDDQRIEADWEWDSARSEERIALRMNRGKAHTWLRQASRIAVPIYRRVVETWLQNHTEDCLRLYSVEEILKKSLLKSKMARLDLSKTDSNTPAMERAEARDRVMIGLSSLEGRMFFKHRRALTLAMKRLKELKDFLQKYGQKATHWCTQFAIRNWLIFPEIFGLEPGVEDFGDLVTLVKQSESIFFDLLVQVKELLAINELQQLGAEVSLQPSETETLDALVSSIQFWWCDENGVFRSAEQLVGLFSELVGVQTQTGGRSFSNQQLQQNNQSRRRKPIKDLMFPACSSPGVRAAVHTMINHYFTLQEALQAEAFAKREFNESRQILFRNMALVSEPLKCFWPPTFYGLMSVTLMARLAVNPLGEVFLNSYAHAIRSGIKTGVHLLVQTVPELVRNGSKLPSEREMYFLMMYEHCKHYRSSLKNLELPHMELAPWNLLGIFAGIAKSAAGSLGLVWIYSVRTNPNSLVPLFPRTGEGLGGHIPSSNYTHGVALTKTIRDQLVRAGVDNSVPGREAIKSVRLLAEPVPVLSELSGEVDLCQEMRFDHQSVQWLDLISQSARNSEEFIRWDFDVAYWKLTDENEEIPSQQLSTEIFNRLQDGTIPVLLHEVRHLYKEDDEMTNGTWERKISSSGPSLIHALLGDLSLDRINLLLNEPSLQRVFEMKLFRPTVLPWVCSMKPQFLRALVNLFSRSIRTQKNIQNISGELYLRYILWRITKELRLVSSFSHVQSTCSRISRDERISFFNRLEYLHEELLGPYLQQGNFKPVPINESPIQLHHLAIHKYYLLWARTTFETALNLYDEKAAKLIASFAVFRPESVGLGPNSVDLHEIQLLVDWFFTLFQSWKSHLINPDGSVSDAKVSALLLPTVKLFLNSEDERTLQGLRMCSWKCTRYPVFSTTVGSSCEITVDPVGGFLFLNGSMRTFVRYEHAIHDVYQRYFGLRLLPCSYFRKEDWDIYKFKLHNTILGRDDQYIVQASHGELFIFRYIRSKNGSWYQYLPDGLLIHNSQSQPLDLLDGLPGFVFGSEAWMKKSSSTMGGGSVFFSWPVDNPQTSVLHHEATFQFSGTKTDPNQVKLTAIWRYPSKEPVRYLKAQQIPESLLAFEHPLHIEFGVDHIYLPRFGLSFSYDSKSRTWKSTEYPGFEISEDHSNVDPFTDGTKYWLTLERKMHVGNMRSYLLLASARPLLSYPSHLGPGSQLEFIRRGTRAVWIDHQPQNVKELRAHFTLTLDLEYPSVLRTSSATGHCWLALLYLAKRDYYNCFNLIRHANFDTNLTRDQLDQLHRILHWFDNSHNACMIKLKIISAFAKNDPNLFCNAENEKSSNGNQSPISMLSGGAAGVLGGAGGLGKKSTKAPGRYPTSLLGMTQEQFFDFYIIAIEKLNSISSSPQSHHAPSPQRRTTESPPAGSIVNLSSQEWSYINRALFRWPTGLVLQLIANQRGLDLTRGYQPPVLMKTPHRLGLVYHQILGNVPGAFQNSQSDGDDDPLEGFSAGISIRDVAFEICQLNSSSTSSSDQLLSRLSYLFVGTPSRNWERYFVPIYQRLVKLSPQDKPADRKELKQWQFLLSCDPFAGDRTARLCRILLFKVSAAVMNDNITLMQFPSKIMAHRTRFAAKMGVNTFGIRKKRDLLFLGGVEQILKSIDEAIPLPEPSGASSNRMEDFLNLSSRPAEDDSSEDLSETGSKDDNVNWADVLPKIGSLENSFLEDLLDVESQDSDEDYNRAVRESVSSYLEQITRNNAPQSIVPSIEKTPPPPSPSPSSNQNSSIISPLSENPSSSENPLSNMMSELEKLSPVPLVGLLAGILSPQLISSLGNDPSQLLEEVSQSLNQNDEIDLSNPEKLLQSLPESLTSGPLQQTLMKVLPIFQGKDSIEDISPMEVLSLFSNQNTQQTLLEVQQGKEFFEYEQILHKRYLDYEKNHSNQAPNAKFEFYRTKTAVLMDLVSLTKRYLNVQQIDRPESVWNLRSDLTFGDQHYEQIHHRTSANLMKQGFDKAWKIPQLDITFKEPEESTVMSLKQDLYKVRAQLEQREEHLVKRLFGLLRRPGLVTSSFICADQAVPLPVVLNLWENNQLEQLEECFGCVIPKPDGYAQISHIVEEIDTKICWRYHVENILKKLDEAVQSVHPLEKKAILETIYHLFNEELCYIRWSDRKKESLNEPIQNRKILSISRANGFLVRKKQVLIANTLLENPNQAIQAALGLGKSSVIVPLVTSGMADGCHCVWLMCPLTDKPETLQRCESVRVILNHSLLVFHFLGDGTNYQPSTENSENESSAADFDTPETNSSQSNSKGEESKNSSLDEKLFPPYRLDSVVHLRELYYDLLRITVERGLVITTRESLLFFVDSYEQLWLNRARALATNNQTMLDKCDELLEWHSKFFPFLKKHARAILDEIDEILKANVKVNLALSDMAKINRDTLGLASECVQTLLDPEQTIMIPDEEDGGLRPTSLLHAVPLMSNCQAATPIQVKHQVRAKLAEHLGDVRFGFGPNHPYQPHYLSFVLCSNHQELSQGFYDRFIKDEKDGHPEAANIVRLRELLGGSFATLFKRHNYSLGRMFTNDNRDDVGPYSAANTPLRNSHLSSEYDWAWALAANYAMNGITLAQFARYVNQVRTEAMTNSDQDQDSRHDRILPASSSSKNPLASIRVAEFEQKFGISVLQVSKHMLPQMVDRINHVGSWQQLESNRLEVLMKYLHSSSQKDLLRLISSRIPDIQGPFENISPHKIHSLMRQLLDSSQAQQNWPQLKDWLESHDRVGRQAEQQAILHFREGIRSRLDFLLNFVNLTYCPTFIEGNATTIVHMFSSACGFSGTMEVPNSLPQTVLRSSDPLLLRDRSIDGIVLSRFLQYALGEEDSDRDRTMYVDDAADWVISTRFALYSSVPQMRQEFIRNRTREVLLGCFNGQAIVDGGALLDVEPEVVVDTLVEDPLLLKLISDPNKPPIQTIRWKDAFGDWMTLDVAKKYKIRQQHRAEPLKLTETLTFYDQQHSRGTDAKLAPDALMVNTIGDETRLTEWSQAEGRARQSGKGQTSKTIIAPHIRFQQTGEGPLAIRLLRTLIRRSSNSEVSEAFYAHAEQLRGYLRDYFRSALTEVICSAQTRIGSSSTHKLERNTLAEFAQKLFIHQCDVDLSQREDLLRAALPFQYTDSSSCLRIIIDQEITHMQEWEDEIAKNKSLTEESKSIMLQSIENAILALVEHQIPPPEALPDGEIGVPRPGEQSFGIVLNTEIAQEQMVEVETEMDLETETNLARKSGELDDLRPAWQDWNREWYDSPLGLWNALFPDSNELFVSMNAHFPLVYQYSVVSRNLGFWPAALIQSESERDHENFSATDMIPDSRFYWLHDAYVDPFVYHVILEHPQEGFRMVTISHQEYSNYVFPLLCKPGTSSFALGYDSESQPKISVFRHEGWDWIEFDSTRCPLDHTPLTVNVLHPECRRILSECCLISGNVEIGSLTAQLDFLQLASDSVTYGTPMVDVLLAFMHQRFTSYFSKETAANLELLQDTYSALLLLDKNSSLESEKEFLSQCSELIQQASSQLAGGTVGDLILLVCSEISSIIAVEMIRQILAKESSPDWLSLLYELFGKGTSPKKLQFIRTQLRVIVGRHRPGIAKKLATAPMWRLVNVLLKKISLVKSSI